METAVILEAVRSPLARALKGAYLNTRIDDIGAQVILGLMRRFPNLDPNLIEDVVIGCAMPEGEQGLNVARNISLLAGLPLSCGAVTVNRFCASSLQAINFAAEAVMCGNGDVFIAGGIESMSHIPMGGFNPSLNEKLMQPAAPDAYIGMGATAENVAGRYKISREDQDKFALTSHKKAIAAQNEGKFVEIVPIEIKSPLLARRLCGCPPFRKGGETESPPFGKGGLGGFVVTQDEGPRAGTSLEALAKLPSAFEANGTVTAGNSSPLTDGAAMTIIASKSAAKRLGLKPKAKIISMAVAGVDPAFMGIAPVYAVNKALKRARMKLKDIDLIEINEAFAAQVLAVVRELKIDESKLNVLGGAIALGHPLGASGARIIATLLSAMKDKNASRGLATMCVGGGQAVATIIELI